jgi:endoglucanase
MVNRFVSALGPASLFLVAATATVVTAHAAADPALAWAYSSQWPLPLKVDGNRILNSSNQPVLLRGVNTPSLEWTNNGEGHILKSVTVAIRDWHVNIIRLPLSQDRWFGKGPEQQDGGASYRALVRQIVDLCSTQGCYIMLDLQWSDCGVWGQHIGLHGMPDRNSLAFWKDCAATYKNHPAVIFDLYNEPHDVPWQVWLNGGTITEKANSRRRTPEITYEAVGLQQLLDTIRATGAKNVVVAGPLDWSYDFSGILQGIQLYDRDGNGVIYANHVYNNKGDSVETWIARMEKAAARVPVIVSEFGGSGGPRRRSFGFRRQTNPNGDDWLLHVMQALQDHHWSWIAWCFHVSAGPRMLSDWDYTPSPDFGVFVNQALEGKLPRYTPPRPGPAPATGHGTNAPARQAPK